MGPVFFLSELLKSFKNGIIGASRKWRNAMSFYDHKEIEPSGKNTGLTITPLRQEQILPKPEFMHWTYSATHLERVFTWTQKGYTATIS